MLYAARQKFEAVSRLIASQIRSDGVVDYDDAIIIEDDAR